MDSTPTPTQTGRAAEACAETRTGKRKCRMSRRKFLLASRAVTTAVSVMLDAGTPLAHEVPGVVASYPRKLVTKLVRWWPTGRSISDTPTRAPIRNR